MNSVVGRRTWRLPKRRFFCRLRLLWVGIEGGGGWVLLFLCQNQLETLHVRLVSENKRESGEEEGNCNARPWSNVCDGGFDSLFFFYLYSSRHSHRINHRSVSIIQTPNQKKRMLPVWWLVPTTKAGFSNTKNKLHYLHWEYKLFYKAIQKKIFIEFHFPMDLF